MTPPCGHKTGTIRRTVSGTIGKCNRCGREWLRFSTAWMPIIGTVRIDTRILDKCR